MPKPSYILIVACFMMILNTGALEAGDLFLQKKSDTATKPLVFPKSLAVLENRPDKMPYFFVNESEKFETGQKETSDSGESRFRQSLSDPKIIRKTLVALDRTRIHPSEQGEDILGPVTREVLKGVAKKYSKDLVLVFRREIQVLFDTPVAASVFQNPDRLLDVSTAGHFSLRIRSLGLVYLAKGNKILVVPFNEKSASFFSEGESLTPKQVMGRIRQLSRQGLQGLSASAKKIIKDNEFVVRRSAY